MAKTIICSGEAGQAIARTATLNKFQQGLEFELRAPAVGLYDELRNIAEFLENDSEGRRYLAIAGTRLEEAMLLF